MNISSKKIFYSAVILQVLFLAAMIAYKQQVLLTGEVITLRTMPVDPRSLFQGDYVTLNYEISRLDMAKVKTSSRDIKKGDVVYVALEKLAQNDYYSPVQVEKEKVSSGKVMKGVVKYVSYDYESGVQAKCLNQSRLIQENERRAEEEMKCYQLDSQEGRVVDAINVEYGIEAYFVPEGQGQALERVRNSANRNDQSAFLVNVAVDRFGQSIIKELLIDGKEVDATDLTAVQDVANGYRPNEGSVNSSWQDQEKVSVVGQLALAHKAENSRFPIANDNSSFFADLNMNFVGNTSNYYYLLGELKKLENDKRFVWLDNEKYPYDFCAYYLSKDEKSSYVVTSSERFGVLKNLVPASLSDCGITLIDPLGTIKGDVYLDNNDNQIFDVGDSLFYDAIVEVSAQFSSNNVIPGNNSEKNTVVAKNGRYIYYFYDLSDHLLAARTKLRTPVFFSYPNGERFQSKQGSEIRADVIVKFGTKN